MQAIERRVEELLADLKQANDALYELTVDLSLLDAISSMTFNVSQALEMLTEQKENSTAEGFVALLAESEAIEILDEIVDCDAISELEDRFFSAIESMDDGVMGGFLTELLEKMELRYTKLVEAIHELNDLLNVEQ